VPQSQGASGGYLIAEDYCSALLAMGCDQQVVGYSQLAAGAVSKARQRREGKAMLNPDLDPFGVSDTPNIVEDPHRQAELAQRYREKLDYLQRSYAFWREALGPPQAFNQSIQDLRDALKGKLELSSVIENLQLEISMAFGFFLEELTGRNPVFWRRCTDEELCKAGNKLVTTISKRRGRPRDGILWLHMKGLMAAVQECGGMRVTAVKEAKDDYGALSR